MNMIVWIQTTEEESIGFGGHKKKGMEIMIGQEKGGGGVHIVGI